MHISCGARTALLRKTCDIAQQPGKAFTLKFFSALEWRTVRVLADIVIPRDATSGSATEAGVPEFMDYVMIEFPNNQTRVREGLGWLNAESRTRFGVLFPDATSAQRLTIVDDIAFPFKNKPEHIQGVRFFSTFRDLTASAFFTSRMGVKDIVYMHRWSLKPSSCGMVALLRLAAPAWSPSRLRRR